MVGSLPEFLLDPGAFRALHFDHDIRKVILVDLAHVLGSFTSHFFGRDQFHGVEPGVGIETAPSTNESPSVVVNSISLFQAR